MSRIVLKISGEALKSASEIVSDKKLEIVLETIKILKEMGHKIAVVVGGGNIFRGRDHLEMNKISADTIGMLGTVINALFIKEYLQANNHQCIVTTPFIFPNLLNNYTKEEVEHYYNEGTIVVFGGGIGKSGYSTDSGTILSSELLNADLIVKMTNVDGVYDSDPKLNNDAKKFANLKYDDVLENHYKVMDEYAVLKCKEKNIKILVMNFLSYKDIKKYFKGEKVGTLIGG